MHQDNISVCFIPPYTPLLYSKTGVYRDIHYFLIFALKHILWVLVTEAILTCANNLCFEQNYKKVKKIQLKIVIFSAMKNRCIINWRVFVLFINLLYKRNQDE